MNRVSIFVVGLLFAFVSMPANWTQAAEKKTPPNVVLILIDDLGWTDLACYGSQFYETPNIDRLAKQGMRFTNAYAACTVCSPTRASILTGKYPARVHITDWIPGYQYHHRVRNPSRMAGFKMFVPKMHLELPHSEITLAELLAPNGYFSASIGKWHLGGKGFLPTDQGFNINIAGTHKGQPPTYFYPYLRQSKKWGDQNLPSLEEGTKGEYLTDRLTDETIKFIDAHSDKPFFLYLPHYAVHTPIQAKNELTDIYKKKVKPKYDQRCPQYAAMIHSTDESVGRILKHLDDKKLSENTLVIFTSDNGGLKSVRHQGVTVTSNLPLRAGKGSPYEGGTRVPLIVRYPGKIKPGIETDEAVFSGDLFPTIAQFCQVQIPQQTTVDGVSLVPLLTEQQKLTERSLFWHYPHYHTGGSIPYSAIRKGDYKLIEFSVDKRVELYNLKNDIGETQNIARKNKKLVNKLRTELEAWRKSVNAQRATPNPDYDPAKRDRSEYKVHEFVW